MTEKQRENLGYIPYDGDLPPKYEEKTNGKLTLTQGGGKGKKYQDPKIDIEMEPVEEDPWKVIAIRQDYKPWNELTTKEKWVRGLMYPVKIVLVLAFLYLFICSLDFLSSAFKLLGGKKAGEVFRNSDILTNPVAGLMMGVLVTVLVQSSSTSTSIVISMVAAGIINPPDKAVPIIMGANIGTSVTNTIVALGQITDKNDFRRAFAGATVHDMFNWLAVLVLLPLEILTGYLFKMSTAIVDSMHLNESLSLDQDLLKVITKPFTTLIISVSSSGIKKIAQGAQGVDTLMKFCCDKVKPDACCKNELKAVSGDQSYFNATTKGAVCETINEACGTKKGLSTPQALATSCATEPWKNASQTVDYSLNALNCGMLGGTANETACCTQEWEASTFFSNTASNATLQDRVNLCLGVNSTCFAGSDLFDKCNASWVNTRSIPTIREQLDCKVWAKEVAGKTCYKQCEFLFRPAHKDQGGPLGDEAIGGILLVISLVLLCCCLVAIVKLLNSLLQGPMAKVIKKFVNADFPGVCAYFTGYLAILLGAGFTILVQSSSIFTSTLTPLVGIGVIELERMYPLTLGSNIGTTFTGILSALAQDAKEIPHALEVAFCHLFFNISGILLFYPLPFFRPPVPAAKFLGNTTAKYRWFAIFYLVCMFFAFPAMVFGLSVINVWVLMVLVPIGLVAVIVGVIKCLQAKKPGVLPAKLRTWKFLPEGLRSLRPYDSFMKKLCFCKRFQMDQDADTNPKSNGVQKNGRVNKGYNEDTDKDTSVSTHL